MEHSTWYRIGAGWERTEDKVELRRLSAGVVVRESNNPAVVPNRWAKFPNLVNCVTDTGFAL
jgi:hypothetical protein